MTASRAAVPLKPSVGGPIAETRKRLSTISGSPSAITTRTATRPGSSSAKEIEDLKAKLHHSETCVEELKAEIASSQEKLLGLGQRLQEEAQRVTEAEENIRSKHDEMVEKLHASHKADVESLQAQLQGAEEARKNAQEGSLKAIEEAKIFVLEQNALDAAEVSERHKAEHAATLAAVAAELESANAAHSSSTEAMHKQNAYLDALKDQLETANVYIADTKSAMASLKAVQEATTQEHNATVASQKEQHSKMVEELKKSLSDEHDVALAALRSQHLQTLENGRADTFSGLEKELQELREEHEAVKASLEARLHEAIASKEALRASLEGQASSDEEIAGRISQLEATITDLGGVAEKDRELCLASEEKLAHLTAEMNETKVELVAAREEIDTISIEHKFWKAKALEDGEALDEAKEELGKTKQEVESLQKMMDAVDQESKAKDDMHNKIKLELAAANKALDEKVKDINILQEKHRRELENVSSDYQTEIDALQGNSGIKEKYEELEAKHADIVKAHNEAATNHTQTLENLKKVRQMVLMSQDKY